MEVQNKKGFEFVAYDTCYGNQLQQVLHQECIDVFQKTLTVSTSSVAYDHTAALCKTIDAAAVYNQEGCVDKASMVLDFCWTVLDYGQAILEGAGLGVVGAVQNAYDHPIITIASVVAGEVVLGYQIAKVIAEVADIGITYAMNADEGVAKLEEYIKPLTQIIDTLSGKEMTMRSALKCGAAVAVGFKAQTTLLGGLQQFYAGIRSNASMYIRSFPSATVEQYLPTPRGGLLKVVDNFHKNKQKNAATLEKPNINELKQVIWSSYNFKHRLPKNMLWNDIVQSTVSGRAFYKPSVDVKALEMHAWEYGQKVTNGKNWKVFKADKIIGAKSGKETSYMRVECSANTIYGHPILEDDYWRYLR